METASKTLKEIRKKHSRRNAIVCFILAFIFILMGIFALGPYFDDPKTLEYYGEYNYTVDEVRINTKSGETFLNWTNQELSHSFEEKVDSKTYNAVRAAERTSEKFTLFTAPTDKYIALKGENITKEDAAKKYKIKEIGNGWGTGWLVLGMGTLSFVLGFVFIYGEKLSKKDLVENRVGDISEYKPFD